MHIRFILFNMKISLLPSHPRSQSEQAHSFSLAASLDLTWWLRLQECSICMGNKILSVLVKACFSLLPGFCMTFSPVLFRHSTISSLSLWDCDKVALPPYYGHNLKHGGNKWFFFLRQCRESAWGRGTGTWKCRFCAFVSCPLMHFLLCAAAGFFHIFKMCVLLLGN